MLRAVTILLVMAATARGETPAVAFPLLDLAGTPHDLGQNDARRPRAFVFLSTECPISNATVPTLNAIKRAGVDFYGVVSDPTVTRAAAAKHYREYKADFPVLFDASGLLAAALKPTHVPEAVVLDAAGAVAYRGAVDDEWQAVGRRRQKAEKTYLADALAALTAGKPVAEAKTTPVGCLFEAPPAAAAVTFARDVAPILHARCASCHRPGQAAPFPLLDYDHAAKRAKQIARVTHDRTMPPWIPGPGPLRFVGDRRLTDRELAVLEAWADGGRAKGDAADLPPPPTFADGWRLGKPDLVLKMAEAFPVPAAGPDVLQNFVLPIDVPEDKLVAAVEFHPGNPRVCHHAVLFLDATGAARKLDAATPEPGYANFGGPGFLPTGALGGWSVGNTPRPLPDGMGRYLKKGSDLVLQMHYHPTGKAEADRSEVGLFFVKKPVAEVLKEPGKLVGSIWLSNYELDVPAGEAKYTRTATYTLPRAVRMVGVVPHMHLLGKTMTVTATRPDKTATTLIDIPAWNYNWQDEYYFERPFTLPAGTVLTVTATFDNSAANPSNPSSPPKRVTWGDGTLDEMMFCFFLLSAERTDDLVHTIFDNLRHDTKQPRGKGAK